MSTGSPAVKDRPDTRQRLTESAAMLFSRQGYGATGIKSVLADAEAPYGSLYHFFPGGKEELGAAALVHGGQRYRAMIDSLHPVGSDPVAATTASFEHAASILDATDFADACPIATIALEVSTTHEPLRIAASDAFDSWLDLLTQRFTEAGIEEVRAREVAVEGFCLMEGSILLARTRRSVEPVLIAGRAAAKIVAAELPDG